MNNDQNAFNLKKFPILLSLSVVVLTLFVAMILLISSSRKRYQPEVFEAGTTSFAVMASPSVTDLAVGGSTVVTISMNSVGGTTQNLNSRIVWNPAQFDFDTTYGIKQGTHGFNSIPTVSSNGFAAVAYIPLVQGGMITVPSGNIDLFSVKLKRKAGTMTVTTPTGNGMVDLISSEQACTVNCTCSALTCTGQTCSDGCSGTCNGTKNCALTGTKQAVATITADKTTITSGQNVTLSINIDTTNEPLQALNARLNYNKNDYTFVSATSELTGGAFEKNQFAEGTNSENLLLGYYYDPVTSTGHTGKAFTATLLANNNNHSDITLNLVEVVFVSGDYGQTVTATINGGTVNWGGTCTPNCSCSTTTCVGQTCSNGCGGTCAGTNVCNTATPTSTPTSTATPLPSATPCVPVCACTVNTCIGQTCSDGCNGVCNGIKECSTATPTAIPTPDISTKTPITIKTKLKNVSKAGVLITAVVDIMKVGAQTPLQTLAVAFESDASGVFTSGAITNGIFTAGPVQFDLHGHTGLIDVRIKGPKHVRSRFGGKNILSTLDLSDSVLIPGDLPWNGVQDGVADVEDWKQVMAHVTKLGEEKAEDLIIADVNYDGVVDEADISIVRETITTRPDVN